MNDTTRGPGSLAAASADFGKNLNPANAEFLLFYDTETTGLPEFKKPSDDPSQPHLVQVGAALVHMPTRTIVETLDVIVRPDGTPEEPAWRSDPKAEEAHGITTERAFAEGIPEADAVQLLLAFWLRAQGRVGHNEAFDRRIFRIAVMRYQGREAADHWYHAPYNCTQFLASEVMQMAPTAKMTAAGFKKPKPPKLTEAHLFFTGRPLDGAHNAMVDVHGCMNVYFAIADGVTTDQSAIEAAAAAEGFGLVIDPEDVAELEADGEPEPVPVHPDQIPLVGVEQVHDADV